LKNVDQIPDHHLSCVTMIKTLSRALGSTRNRLVAGGCSATALGHCAGLLFWADLWWPWCNRFRLLLWAVVHVVGNEIQWENRGELPK